MPDGEHGDLLGMSWCCRDGGTQFYSVNVK